MLDRRRGGGRAPRSHRLLLLAYPRWFRDEYEPQLVEYLDHQRAEPRYRARRGAIRFWWDAGADALTTAARLRLERITERWGHFRRAGRVRGREAQACGGAGDRLSGGHHGGPEGRGMGTLVETLVRDARHAFRSLVRNPGYAAVFVVTLGLGSGANTAMFSAVNGVLLRPLPHDDGERLVYLRHAATRAEITNALFSVPEIEDYRRGTRSLEAVAEFSALTFTMLGHDVPRRVRAGIVTGNYFEVMGLHAMLGRMIGPEDDAADAPAVVVLSEAYWRNVFGSDPDVVGRTVEINARTVTIVGVAEPAPPYPERTDIYVNMATSPHHLDASMNHDRSHRMTEVFARLAPGATAATAAAEAERVTERIHREHPDAYDAGAGYQVTVTPLKAQLTARARPTLLVLLGTSVLVLVIACANLANLTLARVLRRDQELAIRVSLGGSRATLRRELLAESLVLACGGAALGLLLASVSLDLLVAFAERFTSRASEIRLDATVFGVALLAAVVASAFFSVVPTLPDGDSVGGALARGGTRSTSGSGARRAQRALVVAQIGTSFVLLIGAGLLLRTMLNLNRVDPGFDTDAVLSMAVPVNHGAGLPQEELRIRYLSIVDAVRALPGVEDAALTSTVPLSGEVGLISHMEIGVENHEPAPGAPRPRAEFRVVSSGYFAAMGIPVLEGRGFTEADRMDTDEVVVINASMARAYFGEGDAVGRRIAWTDDTFRFLGVSPAWRTVVGVVGDTREAGLDQPVSHTGYTPYRQMPAAAYTSSMVVRVAGDPAAVIPAVREVILTHDPNQPIERVATLADLGSASVAPLRLNALLLTGFAGLALVIAAVGIGAVLAFSVGSRTREFGVRSALGAARHRIWSGVVGEAALLAAVGVLVGSGVAVLLTRFLGGLLVGVPVLDPVTYVSVGVLLGGVAIAAAWAPAWRAARVSPLEALAGE